MALAVASALALVSLPAAAQTSQWRDLGASPVPDVPTTDVNSTQINFGGHEWVVIGNKDKDIYQGTIPPSPGSYFSGAYGNAAVHQPTGSVTLLLNGSGGATSFDAGGGFGTSLFRASGSECGGSYAGDCKTHPNEYNGSTLQDVMDGIITSNAIPGKEQYEINARDLKPMDAERPSSSDDDKQNDGINGSAATGQFWALSFAEWEAVANVSVRSYGDSWWLRSPDYDYSVLAVATGGGPYVTGSVDDSGVDDSALIVRPAFNLNLQSVLFASDASASTSGKSAATTTNGYQSAAQPTGAQKFTFLTSSIATPTLVLQATPLNFTFSDAPLVDADAPTNAAQYVSGFLTKDATTDFYARYVDTTSNATGNFNAATPGGGSLATGTYILHIFSEEANTYLYSDFASHSIDFTFKVTDGAGTVENLTLTSDSAFALDGGTIGLLDSGSLTYSQPWTLGASGGTFDIQNGVTAQISGAIGGTGSLTKDGDGTLILSNASNSYGATTINAGTLNLTGGLHSAVTVANTATLDLRGSVTGNVTLSGSNSTLNAYKGSAITGNLSATNGTLNFFLPGNIDKGATLLTVNGDADISGSTVALAFDGSATSLTVLRQTESINLLHANNLTADPNYTVPALASVGVSFSADFDVTRSGNDLVATLTGVEICRGVFS
ncbi:hypothetical protein FACS1894101_2900 [Betaproteobacteria bacterium]|nr:hypothetical protein FACS1894101_2900 [Betaproteobacteria bacterium]